jgi:hypothetical protein
MRHAALGMALLLVLGMAAALGCLSKDPPSRVVVSEVNAKAPRAFGLGRVPSPSEIEAWDLDVMPDGEGLPAGGGSVEDGHTLYVEACQRCHGVEGRGGPFDVLAGRLPGDAFPFATDPSAPRTIGSYWPYATTLFDYTRRAMPQDRPGSLEDDEVYALTAYLLHLNGLLEEDASIDRTSLPQIIMPARDRFLPDDRRGGPEVR